MFKIPLLLLTLTSTFAFANSDSIRCTSQSNTSFVFQELGAKVTLQAYEIKGSNFLNEGDGQFECKNVFSGGSTMKICDLGNGYETTIFKTDSSLNYGTTLYRYKQSIESDMDLDCNI